MQVEEVIHNSRLYSILIKERPSDKLDEDELYSTWSRHGFLSEIKSVQRTLSRKFTSFRRKRKKEEASSGHDQDCDINKSAINDSTINVCLSEHKLKGGSSEQKLKSFSCKTGRNQNSSNNSNSSVSGINCTGGKSFSRIFGSFRHSFRHAKTSDEHETSVKDTTIKAADQSHDEIISGRDSAYFSLTFSSSDSENEESLRVCDKSHDSIKSVTPPCASVIHHDAHGSLGKRNQACQTEPKKNVTLLLPNTSTPSKPFGIHLQTHTVKIHSPRDDHHELPDGDIAWQLDTIVHVAKVHLLSNFPKFNLSINIIFSPSIKCFMSLNSSTIGALMFHLNRILFSPHLQTITTWEVSLFIIIKFLHHLVSYLHSTGLCQNIDISCVKYFYHTVLKDFCNYKTQLVLKKVQQEFIEIWLNLLL